VVLLDNARDAEQVRPLLPGAPDCRVLVTSRDALTGLATAGAHPVEVGLLDDAESHALLRARLGADRIDAEPHAAGDIVTLCAHLPLALAVVAARAAVHPTYTLAALATQLRDACGSLDEFAGTDPLTDPRAVFSWSYLRLSAPASRLFRLFGVQAGPDIGTRAAASLAALPAAGIRPGPGEPRVVGPRAVREQTLRRPQPTDAEEVPHLVGDHVTQRAGGLHPGEVGGVERDLTPHRQQRTRLGARPPPVRDPRLGEDVLVTVDGGTRCHDQHVVDHLAVDPRVRQIPDDHLHPPPVRVTRLRGHGR
jgi:hypothetical protein